METGRAAEAEPRVTGREQPTMHVMWAVAFGQVTKVPGSIGCEEAGRTG